LREIKTATGRKVLVHPFDTRASRLGGLLIGHFPGEIIRERYRLDVAVRSDMGLQPVLTQLGQTCGIERLSDRGLARTHCSPRDSVVEAVLLGLLTNS
jgi:hypothetical protein